MLLAVRMEGGPQARDAVPLEAGKVGSPCSRGASKKDQPCPSLDSAL